jgi:hypothetical protein
VSKIIIDLLLMPPTSMEQGGGVENEIQGDHEESNMSSSSIELSDGW